MLVDGIQESEQVSEFNTDVSAEWKNTTWRNIYYKGHHPFIYHCELKRCSEGYFHFYMDQFSSDQLLSHVRLIATPCTAAHQASLSITNSQSLLKLMFIERTDIEAETPILLPPDEKSWLIWKDPDAGKDWGQEEKGTTEDEMMGWHHWLNGHEFE